jgi:hypothetical protein
MIPTDENFEGTPMSNPVSKSRPMRSYAVEILLSVTRAYNSRRNASERDGATPLATNGKDAT